MEIDKNTTPAHEIIHQQKGVKTMAFNWKLFVNPAGIPSGFELVCDYAVMHPTRQEAGALIRNKNTGVYAMLIAGAIVSVPQDWAKNNPEPYGMPR